MQSHVPEDPPRPPYPLSAFVQHKILEEESYRHVIMVRAMNEAAARAPRDQAAILLSSQPSVPVGLRVWSHTTTVVQSHCELRCDGLPLVTKPQAVPSLPATPGTPDAEPSEFSHH